MGRGGRQDSLPVAAYGVIPEGIEPLFSKMLTTSDSKEFRIVVPKLLCEQHLAKQMAAASTAAAAVLDVWVSPELVYDEPDERTPPRAVPSEAPASDGEGAAAALAPAADAPVKAEPRPPAGFRQFKYRVSPCGKSFIHSLQDMDGYLQSAHALEGDTVTLCRRGDGQYALFLSRAPRVARSVERPPKRLSAATALVRSSAGDSSADEDADEAGPIACRQNKRVRVAPVAYEPGMAYDPSVATPRPHSAPPKRALPLFANARIRVGADYQARIPDVASSGTTDERVRPLSPAGDRGGEARNTAEADAEAAGADDVFASWPTWRHEGFSLGLSVHGKDLPAIARALGIETRVAVQYYYYRKAHARIPAGPLPDFVTEPLPHQL